MKVTYIGPHTTGVEVDLDGVTTIVAQGESIEIDVDTGITICEQTDNWQPADDDSQAQLDEFYRWVEHTHLRAVTVTVNGVEIPGEIVELPADWGDLGVLVDDNGDPVPLPDGGDPATAIPEPIAPAADGDETPPLVVVESADEVTVTGRSRKRNEATTVADKDGV